MVGKPTLLILNIYFAAVTTFVAVAFAVSEVISPAFNNRAFASALLFSFVANISVICAVVSFPVVPMNWSSVKIACFCIEVSPCVDKRSSACFKLRPFNAAAYPVILELFKDKEFSSFIFLPTIEMSSKLCLIVLNIVLCYGIVKKIQFLLWREDDDFIRKEKVGIGERKFMKEKIVTSMMIMAMLVHTTGCSNATYQKDDSYETDIIGTYTFGAYGESELYEKYILKENNSFEYESYSGNVEATASGTYTTSSFTPNITEIHFDIATSFISDEDSARANDVRPSLRILKYKNMLGSVIEAPDIPKSKTFDYIIPGELGGGLVFEKDGQYHACIDVDNCQCDYEKCAGANYIRKDNIIYFSLDELNSNNWFICWYIVDDYLFSTGFGLTKDKEYQTGSNQE